MQNTFCNSAESGMQLFGRRARADSHGRFHLSCDEMAELYRGFHKSLTDTYWESASNHKICTDAMEAMRTTHISKKSGRFLKNFTALVREVYSHAHYNVHELLYEERETIRQEYWETITKISEIVFKRADHIWSIPCSDKMSILLQFSALFSLYKDVANEEFIQKIYTLAVDYMHSQKHKKDKTEEDRMFDYLDQIQLVFRMRKEPCRGSSSDHRQQRRPSFLTTTTPTTAAVPRMEHRESRMATKEELDEFFDKIMKEQQRQRRGRKVSAVEEEEFDAPPMDMWVASSSHEETEEGEEKNQVMVHVSVTATQDNNHLRIEEVHGSHSRSSSPSRRRGSFVHLPEILSVIKKLNPVNHETKHEDPPPVMEEFDFKAEFEKRFGKRNSTGSTSGVVSDLPVISKPNPMDRVFSYRRQGLFNGQLLRHSVSETLSSTKENILEERLLLPPPKPPRAISPRTMERKIVEAVISGSPVE